MGATIRPLICDFSAGEVGAENDGRIDLDISSHGCVEMTNMLPFETGMASKRGGFKHLCAALGVAKIIEWNISEDVSLLICFYDGYIKLMRLMPDGGLVTMTQLGGDGVTTSDLTISHLDGTTALVHAYSYSDAKYVEYAQNMREITFVCASKYPAFYLKYAGSSSDGLSISIDYGIYGYTGNIAKNPSLVESESVASSEIKYSDFCDKFYNLTSDTDYAMDSGSYWVEGSGSSKVIHNIVKIRKTGVLSARCFSMTSFGYIHPQMPVRNISFLEGIDSSVSSVGFSFAVNTGPVSFYRNLNGHDIYLVGGTNNYFNVGSTDSYITLLDKLDGMSGTSMGYNANVCPPLEGRNTSVLCGNISYKKAINTLSVTITDDKGAAVTIKSSDAGTIKGHFKLQAENIELSGGVTYASDLLDYIIPWMDKNKTYQCSPNYELNGRVPVMASRDDSSETPSLIVMFKDLSPSIKISKGSPGIFGRIGVILTPFYSGTEYPSAVCYHQGRLCLACGNVVYLSKVNDYSNFCYFDEVEYSSTELKPAVEWDNPRTPETETNTSFSQQIGDSSAIKLTLATDENEDVVWMASDGALFIGTATGEWVLSSDSTANKLNLSMIGRMGSANMQARYLMGALMFSSRSGQALHAYDLSNGVQENNNLMFYARHIAASGIVDFDYRQDPQSEALVTLGDGNMLVMRKGKLGVSWCRVSHSSGDKIVSTAVLNAKDEDAIICLVQHGSTYNFERLVTADDSVFPSDLVAGRAHLDSYEALTIAGGTLSIPRLAGRTASIHINYGDTEVMGSVSFDLYGVATTFIRDGDTTNTPVALPNLPVIVGFAFNSILKPCRIDSQETEGLVKGSGKIHLRVYKSGAFKLMYNGVGYAIEPPINSAGVVPFPYTGVIKVENPQGDEVDTNLDFESSNGVPVNIQLVIPAYSVGEVD